MKRQEDVLTTSITGQKPNPSDRPGPGRFSMSCKALCCCVFVVGAILNILLTTILLFGVQNYHKADPVRIYEVFETPKYALTNELLDNSNYLNLYGQHQSGIINFIEHEANLRVIEGKPVVIRQLEESLIKKHIKETKHFVEMYLGQVGRGHHSWFIILNDTETPTHEIHALQKKYPHDSIVLISTKKLDIDGFVSHQFPTLKAKQLKQFMEKDLDMDKKQIKQILDQAATKDAPEILQAFKNHEEAKIKAAEEAERLKRQQEQQQQRLKEEEERIKLQEEQRLAAQQSIQEQETDEEESKKKKSSKKAKGKSTKLGKKSKTAIPEEQQVKPQAEQKQEEQVPEEPKKSTKSSKKQKSGRKNEKPSKNKSKKNSVNNDIEEKIEQQLEKKLESKGIDLEQKTNQQPIVAEVQKAQGSKKSKGGKNKNSKKAKEEKLEAEEKIQEPAVDKVDQVTQQVSEPIVSDQEQVSQQVHQSKQGKSKQGKSEKSRKGKKGSKKLKQPIIVEQVVDETSQTEQTIEVKNAQPTEVISTQQAAESVDQQSAQQAVLI